MKKKIGIIIGLLIIISLVVFVFRKIILENANDNIYLYAHEYMTEGRFDEAEDLLESIPNYKGASELLWEVIYKRACDRYEQGKEAEAEIDFLKITNYSNAKEYLDNIRLHRAEKFLSENFFAEAEKELSDATKTENIIAFLDGLYHTWSMDCFQNGLYEEAYKALDKMTNLTEEVQLYKKDVGMLYARELLKAGRLDDAEQLLRTFRQEEEVSGMLQEIAKTRLAITCVRDLRERYTGEFAFGELQEVRYGFQIYKGDVQLPIVMLRFLETNVATGESREAYAMYDNDTYIITGHALTKDSVDMKSPTEMSAYLKLSSNWDKEGVAILDIECIRNMLLQ